MIKISISDIWNNIWPYLIAVLLFLILIIIHEFGHFIAAKSVGVKVNEFAVGFGPKLFSKQKGETLYRFNLIPLGGYCAMEGEDENSEDNRAFCNKSPLKRFIVVVMGATFNILLGFILIGITLLPQKTFTTTTVAGFYENSVSESTGLKVGDKILYVDGRKIFTTYDLSYSFTNVENGKVDMRVLRDGKKVNLKDVAFDTEKDNDITYLKVDFYVEGQKKNVWTFISETFKTSVSNCLVVWRSLIDLLSGKYGISAMSGPVGVTVAISSVAKQSLKSLIPIMALITFNLGLFNLLPFPALDGGRLLFIIVEMITKKKIPQKYESLINVIGFALLFFFMMLITAKDIWGLIK